MAWQLRDYHDDCRRIMMAGIWMMVVAAFMAWGAMMGNVSLHEGEQLASGAAPMRDGTCGIFIGTGFWLDAGWGGTRQQAVITHEVGHCLGYDHPDEWRLTIMIPNVPAPTEEDLAGAPTHGLWFEPFQYTLTVGGVARE